MRITKKWTTLNFSLFCPRSMQIEIHLSSAFFVGSLLLFRRFSRTTIFFWIRFLFFVRRLIIIIALFLIEKVKNLSLIHFSSLLFSFVSSDISFVSFFPRALFLPLAAANFVQWAREKKNGRIRSFSSFSFIILWIWKEIDINKCDKKILARSATQLRRVGTWNRAKEK